MTTKRGAKAPKFEGREVAGYKIKITNAGDGLSAAMAIDPEAFTLGEHVYVVLECEVGRISFDPVKDTNGVIRVQTLKAGTATTVDKELVDEVLEEQRVKIEEHQGVVRLDFGAGDADDSEASDGEVEPDGGWDD